jgi:gamma-glutamylcysteine synthetase
MIGDDDPITLQEACEMVFRGTVKVSTLRIEADRGNVDIFKVGRRYFTTLRSVRGMMDKCREKRKARVSILTASASNGLSETDQVSSALVALSQTTRALKRSSRST